MDEKITIELDATDAGYLAQLVDEERKTFCEDSPQRLILDRVFGELERKIVAWTDEALTEMAKNGARFAEARARMHERMK